MLKKEEDTIFKIIAASFFKGLEYDSFLHGEN